MKRILFLFSWNILFVVATTYGQSTVIDSTQLLKDQERAGKIAGQLARNREKLAQLEKDFAEKTVNKQKAVEQAATAADENRSAAVDLSNDFENRKKARQAARRARRARRDTKSVQRADKNLQRLEKDISKVKRQIEEDEKALSEVQHQQ